jgi:hypothetical protein
MGANKKGGEVPKVHLFPYAYLTVDIKDELAVYRRCTTHTAHHYHRHKLSHHPLGGLQTLGSMRLLSIWHPNGRQRLM